MRATEVLLYVSAEQVKKNSVPFNYLKMRLMQQMAIFLMRKQTQAAVHEVYCIGTILLCKVALEMKKKSINKGLIPAGT